MLLVRRALIPGTLAAALGACSLFADLYWTNHANFGTGQVMKVVK